MDFPGVGSAWRLVGALLAEKCEEWVTGRRYLKTGDFYKWLDQKSESGAKEVHSEPIIVVFNQSARWCAFHNQLELTPL